jgi:hypothetical protein
VSSEVAKSFGAAVTVPEQRVSGLFLVVATRTSPAGLVTGLGGRVVVRLPDPRKVLALLTIALSSALRNDPAIELVGQVDVDEERFSRFARLVGLDQPAERTDPLIPSSSAAAEEVQSGKRRPGTSRRSASGHGREARTRNR